MIKVKAKININDYKIEKEGILDNDILTVQDNDTNLIFDYKNLILTRQNNDYEIIIDFKNKTISYALTDIPQKFYNNFTILSLTNSNKQVMINYQIEENQFSLDIKHETIH